MVGDYTVLFLVPMGNILPQVHEMTGNSFFRISATGTQVTVLGGHSDEGVSDIDFSRDNQLLVSIDHDGVIYLWSMTTFERLVAFDGHAIGLDHVAFSPDGTLLVSSGEDGKLILWGIPKEN